MINTIRLSTVVARPILLVAGLVMMSLIAPARTDSDEVIRVSTAADLVAALGPHNAGRHIRMQPGEYAVKQALTVPDGATLEGAGRMRMENGLPAGFAPGTTTTVRVVSGFEGDLLTLGNGAVLRGLRLEDLRTGSDSSLPRMGNVIAVLSRAANDTLSAEIHACEIINPNPFGVRPDGPAGHGLVILTRNPVQTPAHENSTLAVRVERSIVRATGGGGAVFALNFAARGKLSVRFAGNLFKGTIIAGGGTSRPDLVTGASVEIESRNNLYTPSPGGYTAIGWRLYGGSSAHVPGMAAPGARLNMLRLVSEHDRIEDFQTGIHAAAARRWQSASGPVSDNRLELDLRGAYIRTNGDESVDFSFQAALSDPEENGNREFTAGDRNILHIHMKDTEGSPSGRANHYANVFGPKPETNQGTGNRLEFSGSLAQFTESNKKIVVAPPAEFFVNEQRPQY